jgi:hypothetical protein
MSRNPIVLWLVTIPSLCIVLLLAGVTQGSSVAIPHTFNPNTVALSAQVNANFTAVATAVNDNHTRITALENGRTQVFSSTDSDAGGNDETGVGQKEMNSIAINLPTAGFLTISGHVFINNNSAAQSFTMRPLVDGVVVAPAGWATAFTAAADAAGVAELFCLNYTITTPITAGAHTISHTAGPDLGTANWFHNAERLTATFVSNGSVTPAPSPLILGAQPGSQGD